MPKIKLNQEAPFTLAGVTLLPGENEYSQAQLDALMAHDASMELTISAGLVEIVEGASKPAPEAAQPEEAEEPKKGRNK